jgi:exosortase/archaeosortase family protein
VARALPLLAGLLWFGVLYGLYTQWPQLALWAIEDATVRPAAALLAWWDPGMQARAQGSRLVVSAGALQVLRGCEGTDLALLSASAMLAAPLAWRQRLIGLAIMLFAVFVLNQVRLLVLLQAHLNMPQHFEQLHTLWLPLLMVLLLGGLLLTWVGRFARP